MRGIGGEVLEFIAIGLQVMQKLIRGLLIKVARIDVALAANALPGERGCEIEVLAKEVVAPGFVAALAFDER